MRNQWKKKKKKSLIRLCSFAFFLIIYGFIAVRTMRWRTALWEGDSPLGYAPQKYELCEILINKKISELFNPMNGALFSPVLHTYRGVVTALRGARAPFYDNFCNFLILQNSAGITRWAYIHVEQTFH